MALLSSHKTCLDRLIWSRCFKYSLKMLSARSYLEQRHKHYIVHNILPFVHGLCRGLHLLYWDEKMSVLPDLHSSGVAPILMKKQVFLRREVSKLTDFPPSLSPFFLSPLQCSLSLSLPLYPFSIPLLLYWKLLTARAINSLGLWVILPCLYR